MSIRPYTTNNRRLERFLPFKVFPVLKTSERAVIDYAASSFAAQLLAAWKGAVTYASGERARRWGAAKRKNSSPARHAFKIIADDNRRR
ncbi:hypothetical protein [Methylobacterium nodulans]|uniref:hypothetical protein n=1 Tax=Methylobacterium nodulans TaxID=114616 RepID=UPI0012EDFB14|nr:hypothetical protein [Methylobacterium nodulans]